MKNKLRYRKTAPRAGWWAIPLLIAGLIGAWALLMPVRAAAQEDGVGSAPADERPPDARPPDARPIDQPPRRDAREAAVDPDRPRDPEGPSPQRGFGRGADARPDRPGRGPGFGRPPAGPPDGPPGRAPDDERDVEETLAQPLNPRRWQALADVVERWRVDFDRLESERAQALTELDAARGGFDPARMDPAAVLKRRQIDGLLGRLHACIDEQGRIQEQAGRFLSVLEERQEIVRELLARMNEGQGAGNPARQRRLRRWNDAMAALSRGEHRGYAEMLLGTTLGPLALKQSETPPEAGAHADTLGERVRQRFQQRRQQIDDLDRRQHELEMTVNRQSMEIERLRQQIAGLMERLDKE
jgi:hypothetical protein